MILIRIWVIICSIVLAPAYANEVEVDNLPMPVVEPSVGSWSFSGVISNESGDRYGYFFQVQRQASVFHVKTALIDGISNQLVLFYEHSDELKNPDQLNWRIGRSFMRYNPINDSWIFGVTLDDEKGFNFKVDMLKQVGSKETLILRPGVELQAQQTSRLNGHIHTGKNIKEQFVSGNNAWFGKVWFSKEQTLSHNISTTFCRLSNDNGFYSANLKEVDATGAAVAGWRDASGNKVKMSQFVSIKAIADHQCLLQVGLPKLSLKVMNTLKEEADPLHSVAGFSKDPSQGFCYVNEQSFMGVKDAAVGAAVKAG